MIVSSRLDVAIQRRQNSKIKINNHVIAITVLKQRVWIIFSLEVLG